MNLELSNPTPEIRAAIAAIATLSSTPVILREITVVETADPTIGALLSKLLGIQEHDKPRQPRPKMAMLPAENHPANREPRACEICGVMYHPVRKDQRYCANCKGKSKIKEVGVVPPAAPLSATPTAPSDSILWQMLDGPKRGMQMTPGQLGTLIALGEVFPGQRLMHSARGEHRLVIRKGRLTPEAVEAVSEVPETPAMELPE